MALWSRRSASDACQGEDVVPIPGTKRADRVAENVAATELSLSGDELARLEQAAGRDAWAGDRYSFAAPGTQRAAR